MFFLIGLKRSELEKDDIIIIMYLSASANVNYNLMTLTGLIKSDWTTVGEIENAVAAAFWLISTILETI